MDLANLAKALPAREGSQVDEVLDGSTSAAPQMEEDDEAVLCYMGPVIDDEEDAEEEAEEDGEGVV